MTSDVPAREEDQEVGKWNSRGLRFGREDAEDRRVDVIPGDTSNADKFLHSILVWDVADKSN